MATIKGVWVFNDTVKTHFEWLNEYQTENVKFTSNGQSFTDAYWNGIDDGDGNTVYHIYYADTLAVAGYYGDISNWENEAYKTVDFGTTEQTVSDEFYNWLTANATQQAETTTGKKFTKLNLCAAVATIGRRIFRKLSTLFPLTAPSIELEVTILNIYDEERLATSYDILVNGEKAESTNVPTYTLKMTLTDMIGSDALWYRINGGEWISSPDYDTEISVDGVRTVQLGTNTSNCKDDIDYYEGATRVAMSTTETNDETVKYQTEIITLTGDLTVAYTGDM